LFNLVFLGVVLASVFITRPPFLREGLMIAATFGSYYTTRPAVHEANHFNFHPIEEVAILFLGIFATMMPALDWLQANAAALGEPGAAFFFWTSGSLSSLLDNAPTYLSFLKALSGAFVPADLVNQIHQLLQAHPPDSFQGGPAVQTTLAALQQYYAAAVQAGTVDREQIETAFLLGNHSLNRYLVAVSVGAVFFGANTYLGNGPNFMVKAIADHQRVRTPGFLAYIWRYTLPVMLPILILVWLLFFR
jgi:Na+/H+ antiporter NhaD/arsenite permease-like protein